MGDACRRVNRGRGLSHGRAMGQEECVNRGIPPNGGGGNESQEDEGGGGEPSAEDLWRYGEILKVLMGADVEVGPDD